MEKNFIRIKDLLKVVNESIEEIKEQSFTNRGDHMGIRARGLGDYDTNICYKKLIEIAKSNKIAGLRYEDTQESIYVDSSLINYKDKFSRGIRIYPKDIVAIKRNGHAAKRKWYFDKKNDVCIIMWAGGGIFKGYIELFNDETLNKIKQLSNSASTDRTYSQSQCSQKFIRTVRENNMGTIRPYVRDPKWNVPAIEITLNEKFLNEELGSYFTMGGLQRIYIGTIPENSDSSSTTRNSTTKHFIHYYYLSDAFAKCHFDRNCVLYAIDDITNNGIRLLKGGGATPPTPDRGGGRRGGNYKPCTGTYSLLCFSSKIKELQKCVGVKPDGYWGRNTEKAVVAKFDKNTLTDAEINQKCKTQPVVPPKQNVDVITRDQFDSSQGSETGSGPDMF